MVATVWKISWILPIWLLLVWVLWAFACSYQRALADTRAGVPPERRARVSIFPVVPLYPLAAWGLAAIGDRFVGPYGSIVMAVLHGVFASALLLSVFRDRSALKALERPN